MASFWAYAALSLVCGGVHALGLNTEFHQLRVESAKRDASMGSTVFNKSAAPDWMLNVESFTGSCAIYQNCLKSTSLPGTCTVRVDPAKAKPLCSTTLRTTGKDALLINGQKYLSSSKTAPCGLLPTTDLTWTSKDSSSAFNLCWHDNKAPHNARLAAKTLTEPLSSRCFWVNGLCWLWASPCSGSCATVTLGDQHPGMLRYATEAEFAGALPTFMAQRTTFFGLCAASMLEHQWTHCDDSDVFSRHGPSNTWASDELVLIYEAFATTGGGGSTGISSVGGGPRGVSAQGDPHLVNIYGQRFDLHQIGRHMLLQVPLRPSTKAKTLLRVDAEAQQLGTNCADTYFTSLNLTGRWVHTAYGSNNMQFTAGSSRSSWRARWLHLGSLSLKIAKGHTDKGIEYLNFFVKHLAALPMKVGGLLGEDDHTAAATPSSACKKMRIVL